MLRRPVAVRSASVESMQLTSSMVARVCASALLLALACGGDDGGGSGTSSGSETTASTDPTTSTSAEGSSTGPGDTSSGSTSADSSGGSSSGGSSSGVDSSSSDGGSSSGGSETTGGVSELMIEPTGLQAFMNCKPIVPADPLFLMGSLSLDNQGAAITSADVTSVRLLANGADAATIAISPGAFGPLDAGESTSVPFQKVADSLMPASGCDGLSCGAEYDLEVTLDVDGAVAVGSAAVIVECAF